MKVIGLTGGIGMGKSTAARFLGERGLPVVDTDQLARRIVEPGQPALAEIQHSFGPAIMESDGRLSRNELARIVFDDSAARKRLEDILHPRIRRLWSEQVAVWRAQGRAQAVVVIPLLFETGAAENFDVTICVACSAVTQYGRLQARGWTSDHIAKRNRSQLPVEKKMELANYIVWTEGSLELHAAQLRRILP